MTVGAIFADVGSVSLRLRVDGEGPRTLVLVHEMGGTLESWDPVCRDLSGAFRIVRYDMRGHGFSEKIRGPVAMADAVADLGGIVALTAGAGPVILVGSALGGGIALQYAAGQPERLAGIVALGPAIGVAPAARPRVLAMADTVEERGARWLVDEDMLPATWPQDMRTDPAAFARFRGIHLGNDPKSYAATYRMLADADFSTVPERIACPVLVLAGRRDPARSPEVHAAFAARMPKGRCEPVDSGHFMAAQSPGLVAAAIRDFAASLG
jgi:3-oxoadipate enol-lactonase